MSVWILAVGAALAGRCDAVADELIAQPSFEESFREGMTSEAQQGFIQGMKSSGVEDPAFLQFAAQYWTGRIDGYMQSSYPHMQPALREWVVTSIGCKRIKKLGRIAAGQRWDALTESEGQQLAMRAPNIFAHPSITAVMEGLDTFMQSQMPEFNEAVSDFLTPVP
jgi:hypothetical protein